MNQGVKKIYYKEIPTTYKEVVEEYGEKYLLKLAFPSISKLPTMVTSPFREESNPSFKISYYKDHIVWTDFGTGESGNLYQLIDRLIGIKNFLNFNFTKKIVPIKVYKVDTISKIKINILPKEWNEDLLFYFRSYGVLNPQKYNVIPIDRILVNGNEQCCDEIAFAYKEIKDNIVSFKIYQPYSKRFKWLNNHNKSVVDLFTLLPEKGEKLVITSSRKDAMCIWDNFNIPAIAPQSETTFIKDSVMSDLSARFDKIFILFDNDITGIKNAKIYASKYNLNNIINITEVNKSKYKDPSDIYKYGGKELLITTFKEYL